MSYITDNVKIVLQNIEESLAYLNSGLENFPDRQQVASYIIAVRSDDTETLPLARIRAAAIYFNEEYEVVSEPDEDDDDEDVGFDVESGYDALRSAGEAFIEAIKYLDLIKKDHPEVLSADYAQLIQGNWDIFNGHWWRNNTLDASTLDKVMKFFGYLYNLQHTLEKFVQES